MPITVKHGDANLSAMAQLAVLMGVGQARGPELPHFGGGGGGFGGGGGSRRPSGGGGGVSSSGGSGIPMFAPRAPFKYGLSESQRVRMLADEERRAKKFGVPIENELRMGEAKAKAKQAGMEYSEISKARAKQIQGAIQKAEASGKYSKKEMEDLYRAGTAAELELPLDTTSKEPVFEPVMGQDGKMQEVKMNKPYVDSQGNSVVWEAGKDGPSMRLLTDFQGSKQGVEFVEANRAHEFKAKNNFESDKAQTLSKEKRQEQLREYLKHLDTLETTDPFKAGKGDTPASGGPDNPRPLNRTEYQEKVDRWLQNGGKKVEGNREAIEAAGLSWDPMDADLPEPLALKQAYLRDKQIEFGQNYERAPLAERQIISQFSADLERSAG